MPEPSEREIEIFNTALELPATERAAYLNQVCAGDAALRQRVEELLQAGDKAGAFLGTSAEVPPGLRGTIRPAMASAEKPGDRIGRYKLLQLIGEGGCGLVYMAEQEEPVRRRVALKVIKLGMDTKLVIARFEVERQALALMDHPNIAKVLDAGATETGRPYFVMDLVKAILITRYCDENNLSTVARLRLFVQVCQAIQHAHQKGIIHRDIKPSNILVADHDGVPMPKIIDFGIAKATTDQRLTDKTLFTAFEQFVGTPAYMSPEQAKLSGLDIDTRSDIYSLGVLLYELLTGRTPFEAKRLLEAGLDEVRRIIREEEPVPPSTKLHTLDAAEQTTVAKLRQSDPPKLVSMIHGDLDWIVMKCLEKDRNRRYETANGLAMDIERHLGNEPVLARPPSAAYRLQKAWRRNKTAFAIAALMAAVLMAATGISVWQATLAKRRLVESQANETLAKQRLAEAEAISKFLTEVFQSPDPSHDGRTITMVETLGAAVRKLETDLASQPALRAKLQETLAWTYHSLGLNREAIPLQEKVRDYRLATYGLEHPDTLMALHKLGIFYDDVGRRDEAFKLREEVLPLCRKVSGPENSDTLWAMSDLADSFEEVARRGEALKLREEMLSVRRKVNGPNDPAVVIDMISVACSYASAGRQDEALKLREEALALGRKVDGPEHPQTLVAMRYLGNSYDDVGRRDEALKLREDVLTLDRKMLGPENSDTLWAMSDLATSFDKAGRREEALKLREQVLTLHLKVSGPEHPDTLWAMFNLTDSYDKAGRREEALKLREQMVTLRRKVSGPEDEATLFAMIRLADSYQQAGRRDEFLKMWQEVLGLSRKAAEKGNWVAMNQIAAKLAASCNSSMRDGAAAVNFAEKAVAATNRRSSEFLDTLAAAYAETGQFEKAIAVEQEAMGLLQGEEEKTDYASRLKLYQAHKPYRTESARMPWW